MMLKMITKHLLLILALILVTFLVLQIIQLIDTESSRTSDFEVDRASSLPLKTSDMPGLPFNTSENIKIGENENILSRAKIISWIPNVNKLMTRLILLQMSSKIIMVSNLIDMSYNYYQKIGVTLYCLTSSITLSKSIATMA